MEDSRIGQYSHAHPLSTYKYKTESEIVVLALLYQEYREYERNSSYSSENVQIGRRGLGPSRESFGTGIPEYTPSDSEETEDETADVGTGHTGRKHR
ncbi:hypothetical protein SAMN05216559_1905 [Halomicrobium zhouii]|uniref:Uncharacterized protein n=1 Tax=Halomicrobium zhouii TaxID=767519 RepID=A0A1I6L2S5_9EURY|nr:hypothetical protein SAMN05216559_1905 [Halomicrobium zhouii]